MEQSKVDRRNNEHSLPIFFQVTSSAGAALLKRGGTLFWCKNFFLSMQ